MLNSIIKSLIGNALLFIEIQKFIKLYKEFSEEQSKISKVILGILCITNMLAIYYILILLVLEANNIISLAGGK